MSTTGPEPTPPPKPQEVLTLPEAAAYLRVSEDALRQLAAGQVIPARKIGEEWRFLKEAVRDWLRGGHPVEERWSRVLLQGLWPPSVELLLAELERRVFLKLPALDHPTPKGGSKQRLLELAGAWKDDSSLEELLKAVYSGRGRSMAGGEE
jgi:excisionase family DNA binding protein